MRRNAGGADRALRVVAGIGLIDLRLTNAVAAWGWIGLLPLATGLMDVRPACSPFGFRTCPMNKASATRRRGADPERAASTFALSQRALARAPLP